MKRGTLLQLNGIFLLLAILLLIVLRVDPPASIPEEVHRLQRCFAMYDEAPVYRRSSRVPAYAIPCSFGDCALLFTQIRAIDAPLGHLFLHLVTDDSSIVSFAEALAAHFPTRVHVEISPARRSMAESWNKLLTAAFRHPSAPAWAFLTNADMEMQPAWLPFFATYANAKLSPANRSFGIVRMQRFSAVAIAGWAYTALGPFDEVIYPGYGEDDEYILRATSLGVRLDDFPKEDADLREFAHIHHGGGGASVKRSKTNNVAKDRWDKTDYIYRKWGVDLSKCHAPGTKDFTQEGFRPYAYPFNLSTISHRHSFHVDPVHRRCIMTGVGPRLFVDKERITSKDGLCYGATPCDACWYDYSTHIRALARLPDDAVLPARIVSRWRQQY